MNGDGTIDRDALTEVLEDHPVSLAVLFGSVVSESRHPQSDVDIVVEFDGPSSGTLEDRLSLISDLSVALETNAIDLAVVDDLDPQVGVRAFREGELLIGSEDRFTSVRRRFDRMAGQEARDPPAERYDAALDRIDRLVGG